MSGLNPTIQIEGDAPKPAQGAPNLDPDRTEYVTDRLGRRLGFKRLSMHFRRMAINALSVENSQKPLMLGPAFCACCCVSINDEKLDPIFSEMQLNARMQRLDTYGVDAINKVLMERFPETDEDMIKN